MVIYSLPALFFIIDCCENGCLYEWRYLRSNEARYIAYRHSSKIVFLRIGIGIIGIKIRYRQHSQHMQNIGKIISRHMYIYVPCFERILKIILIISSNKNRTCRSHWSIRDQHPAAAVRASLELVYYPGIVLSYLSTFKRRSREHMPRWARERCYYKTTSAFSS